MDAVPQLVCSGIGISNSKHSFSNTNTRIRIPKRLHRILAVVTDPKPTPSSKSLNRVSNGSLPKSPPPNAVNGSKPINGVGVSTRIGDVSTEIKRVRAQMEENEDLAILMRGLRGQNLSDSQFAQDDVELRLVEVDESSEFLPLVYDPDSISAYWGKRPRAVLTRVTQLLSVAGGFLSRLVWDIINKKVKENEVARAIELREIVTSLGPAYIKLGQALSIRPDILSPAAMTELQKLCDKVPSFPDDIAMALIEEELGQPWPNIYSELSPSPIAAASLGQVYKGRLKENGDLVAVKVQRPFVLETVTVDLFVIRNLGLVLRKFPQEGPSTGLVTKLTDDQKYGMIEAIAHLIHRDYAAIVKDFVKLEFISEGVNLEPILPVLAKVFDQALEGGGAKNINFQELASDLAQITFDYPFRIPPYFALIIRAIGVLEGIALVGNPDFAIVDEAYPYIAQRLLTDESPRLRGALRYTIYGKSGVFDAERFIDVMQAFETFITAAKSGGGEELNGEMAELGILQGQTESPFPGFMSNGQPIQTRTALAFLLSDKGSFFREFLLDEIVKGIDAVTREQLVRTMAILGLGNPTPVFSMVPTFGLFKPAGLVPTITEEDRVILNNVQTILEFLTAGSSMSRISNQGLNVSQVIQELLPVLPSISSKVLPEVLSRLSSRVIARVIRDTIW
ncbi:hypothetical protein C1H46_010801 [Malus baccata]|uniref:ABC1 atypical kinase-like domain-containing protein n=1 Tax=Malus baccata TaxID=106549 RepID=A0A540MXG1_MALBA|nr:hypothetical protein C1H46_010801 [Malus baccata]